MGRYSPLNGIWVAFLLLSRFATGQQQIMESFTFSVDPQNLLQELNREVGVNKNEATNNLNTRGISATVNVDAHLERQSEGLLQSISQSDAYMSSGGSYKQSISRSYEEPKAGRKIHEQQLSFGMTTFEQSLSHSNAASADPACIWLTVSERGLDYLKDVLLQQILQSITPLHLPDIRKKFSVPVLGEVDAVLTKVMLQQAQVDDSIINVGDSRITVTGSGLQANMTLQWHYKYYVGWIPVPISDRGTADVKVRRTQSGISVKLVERDGGLSVRVIQCGTSINDVEVALHGGTSWLYQWMVDAFEERIRATVENQLNVQIRKGFQKLDTLLFELPRKIVIDETTKFDFTIVHAPILFPTYVSIGLKGLFENLNSSQALPLRIAGLPPGLICSSRMKMLTIALSESMLNSAAAVYYNEFLLNQLVEKVPDEAYRNTAKWRFLAPRLYAKYPNKDMKLVFSVSSTPNVSVTPKGIEGVATAAMLLEILDKNVTTPVACISITFSLKGSVGIDRNNITAQVGLNDLILKQEWSNVGDFRLRLVKIVLRTALKDILLPLLNVSLRRGFPLPVTSSVELQRADINYGNGYILVCTDVNYTESP